MNSDDDPDSLNKSGTKVISLKDNIVERSPEKVPANLNLALESVGSDDEDGRG